MGDRLDKYGQEHKILDQLVEIVIQVDRDMNILWGNRAAADAGNTTPGQLPGRACYGLWRRKTEICADCPVRQAMEEKRPITATVALPDQRYWRVTGTPLFDENDIVTGAIETALDITEQVEMEQELRRGRQELAHLVAHIPGVIVRLDHGFRLRFMSDQAAIYLGIHPCQWLNKPLQELPLPKELLALWVQTATSVLAKGTTHNLDFFLDTQNMGRRWLRAVMVHEPSETDETGVLTIVTDVTEQRVAEERYRNLFEAMNAGLAIHEMIWGSDGTAVDYRFLEVNDRFEYHTGLKREDIIGKSTAEVLPELEPQWIEMYADVVRSGKARTLTRYSRPLGRYYDISAFPYGSNQFVTVFYDITQQREAEERVRFLSRHDRVTGLNNRTFFESLLEALDRSQTRPTAVLLLDINGLKVVNEQEGHAAGDELLRRVAQVLQEHLGDDGTAARWGGDEFAAVMPNTTPAEVEDLCRRVRRALRNPGPGNPSISVSIGWAIETEAKNRLWPLLFQAEDSMYRKKLLAVNSNRSSIISSLQRTLQAKSHETEEHARHLQELCLLLGSHIGLSEEQLNDLSILALLHDIGKVGIPESVLNKPGPLSDEEWKIMKEHPTIGYRIVSDIPHFFGAAEGILCHHERWDGTGYPRKLKGDDIPLLARILSIADSFEAMTADRVYRKGMSKEEALEEIRACAGFQFDPELAEVFAGIMTAPS